MAGRQTADYAMIFQRRWGEPAILEDGSTATIIRRGKWANNPEEGGGLHQEEIHLAWIPTRDAFPAQRITIDGAEWFAAQPLPDEDGWTRYQCKLVRQRYELRPASD